MREIGHGAQARVYITEDGRVVKERVPKSYRHPRLDEWLNETRTKAQARMLEKLGKSGLLVPRLLRVQNCRIEMEYVDGVKMRDHLENITEGIPLCLREIGALVRRLHQRNVIHGDLTTSNMIWRKGGDIYLLDFGLSYVKNTNEDKAVDLYVLERAFKSTHPKLEEMFRIVLEEYGNQSVLKKLQLVRSRGRKKLAFG